MRHVQTPLSKGFRVREGQLMQLAEFAEVLEKGMLVAVNVDASLSAR